MNFVTCSYFIADTSKTEALFSTFPIASLSVHPATRNEHVRLISAERLAQVKNAGRTVFESAIQIAWCSCWILPATIIALATAFIYLAKPTLTRTGTINVSTKQNGTWAFHKAESLITQFKDGFHMKTELLRLTPIPSSAYKERGVKKLKPFYEINNPVVYYEHGLLVAV